MMRVFLSYHSPTDKKIKRLRGGGTLWTSADMRGPLQRAYVAVRSSLRPDSPAALSRSSRRMRASATEEVASARQRSFLEHGSAQ